jgi:uncharacterized GH25 family protein
MAWSWRIPALLMIALVVSAPARRADAHDFWLEPQNGEYLLRYGHHGAESLPLTSDKVRTLSCRKGKGAKVDLRAAAVVSPKELRVKASCVLVSAFMDGGYYSLTPDGEKNLPKNKVPDAVKSWRSKQFAKWIDTRSPLASQPLGDEFEIVPVTDLARVKAGDKATFRILLAGKPVEGAVVAVDHKPLGETDDDGEVRVKIRASAVESVSASFRRAIRAAEADSEVFEANLSFEVSR